MQSFVKILLPYIAQLKFISGHRRTIAEVSGVFGGLGLFLASITHDPANLDAASVGFATFCGALWTIGKRFANDSDKDDSAPTNTEAAKG